jgi:outer membrane protein OmpA-like peptidoglycan-associated protein
MNRIRIAFLCIGLCALLSAAHAQHYSRNAARLGIIAGVNVGGDEATIDYASYSPHPYGMLTGQYFIVDRMALSASLIAGTLAGTLKHRSYFQGYGRQAITGYEAKYYGASAGMDWALPDVWGLIPVARFRLGTLYHHTRVKGAGGFERRLAQSALTYALGGAVEYPLHRDVHLAFSYDLVLTNSDELDGLLSGDNNDALSVFTIGLNFLLRPGERSDPIRRRPPTQPDGREWQRRRTATADISDVEYEYGQGTGTAAWDGSEDGVRGGLTMVQTPDIPERFVPVEEGGVLQLSTSLAITPLRRFADLERRPDLFTLTARQTGRETMLLKNYVEILKDNRTIYQGNVELRLRGRERSYNAREFLDLDEFLTRVQGDAPLAKGTYIVRVSTVEWDHELSSISQAKFLNMDLRPIFGDEAESARNAIVTRAVDVAVEKEDKLVVNFFDAAQRSATATQRPAEAAREAMRLTPHSLTSQAREQKLADDVQQSFTEALKLRDLASAGKHAARLKVVIAEIFFPLDEDLLTEEGRVLLDNVARHLNQHPELYAEIRGYANDIGDETWNATLARRRADRAMEYLVRQKTSSWRLSRSDEADHVAAVRPGEDPRSGRKVEVIVISR